MTMTWVSQVARLSQGSRLSQLSQRDRRTLVLGAVAVAAMLLVFRGIPAWRARVRDSRAEAEALTERLALTRRIVAQQSTHDGVKAPNVLSYAPALLDGDTPAQAAAALASYVSETAAAAGVQLGGIQLSIDSSAKDRELYHVRVRADGSGDVRGVTTLLQLLESDGVPLLAVREFSISQSDPAAPPNRAETLRISFEAEGLARQGGEP